MTAIESCREGDSKISYEQAMTVMQDTVVTKSYYVVDVTALYITEKLSGFVVVLKDVTELKKSMQRLQDNQARMMEQDRLASLGQMIGGVAHNLKTPIMSISGCISAVEELVDECEESLADPGVTTEDYNEIYREMRDWFEKMRESSSYMSDIITAIKGQAASVSTSEDVTFTVEDLIKRSLLLIRHELMASNCRVVSEGSYLAANIRGDINNLVQVLNNMISNAAYAQKQVGGGDIVIGVETDTESLTVFVKDTGPGFSPRVKQRLFKEMVTSKGTQGTGLGLYISDAVVRGKFGGSMWMEDNPKGGAVVGFTIPTDTAIETVKT